MVAITFLNFPAMAIVTSLADASTVAQYALYSGLVVRTLNYVGLLMIGGGLWRLGTTLTPSGFAESA